MEDASERKLIQLEPFAHQVGGHSSMLCLDGATVAKPLVNREQRFYENLPATLRPFVPSFHGALEVHVLQGEGGYVTHAAAPPPLYRPHLGLRTRRSRIRLHDSGDIEIEGENEGMVFEDEDEEREQVAARSKEGIGLSQLEEEEEIQRINRTPRPSVGHALNPWVLRCHRESLSGLTPGTIQNFILLENLTARFKQPCVLDLKVGTRQYGDSASPAKVRSKMMKVATTTSGKLGLRLGGMQVYQVTTRRFLCRNKLFGRALTVEGFRMALVQFLHNGWYIRLDVVRPLLERLEALEGILTRLCAARFYTCSLLCLYEGELKTPSTTPLSPSTPAPPITPGPFSFMPPGTFSPASSRFTFPTPSQASTEAHTSILSLVDKPVSNALGSREKSGLDLEIKPSVLPTLESQAFPKPLGSASNIVSAPADNHSKQQVPQASLFKAVTSEGILSDHMSAKQTLDLHVCKTSTSQSAINSTCLKNSSAFGEHSDGSSLVDKTTLLTLEKSSATQGKGIQEASVSHSFISTIDSSASLPSMPPKDTLMENGTMLTNIKLDISYQNSKIVQDSGVSQPSQYPTKKDELSIVEEQVFKCERKASRQSKRKIGRSVSAESVSYVKVAKALSKVEAKVTVSPLVKKTSNSESKVNGYVENKNKSLIAKSGGEGHMRRSRSLEPQVPLHAPTNSQNPFVQDGILSCYTSVSSSPLVDVRLIDFAHSTHKGLADPVTYAGPDQGFLFGLHNLIHLLQDIAQEATTAMERC